ncbi:MAG: LPP20 family lipoprotein [Nitrospinota bacterium]
MKRFLLYTCLVGFTVGFFGGCSSKTAQVDSDTLKGEFKNAPNWVLSSDMEGGLSAVGSAKIGNAGMAFAKTEAMTLGRDEISRQMNVKVKSLVKNFTQVTGIGDDEVVDKVSSQVSKQVVKQVLSGSKQKNLWISPSNELYVLVVVDPSIIKETIKNSVATSYKNDEALWQQFQAKKAHEDLDKEIEKEFNDFKK